MIASQIPYQIHLGLEMYDYIFYDLVQSPCYEEANALDLAMVVRLHRCFKEHRLCRNNYFMTLKNHYHFLSIALPEGYLL